MSYLNDNENETSGLIHIKENKKIYRKLRQISLEDAIYVENQWHHVCLTALELNPSTVNCYKNIAIDLDFEEIQDIINAYGIEPPQNHWYWGAMAQISYIETSNNIFKNYL